MLEENAIDVPCGNFRDVLRERICKNLGGAMSTTTDMVERLARVFSQAETISYDTSRQLGRLMDQAPVEALILIVKADIKFCASVARNRLRRQHGWTWEEIRSLNDSHERENQ